MTNPKIGRIGVLAGGPSNEREISLRSGKAVHKALLESHLDAVFLDVCDDIYAVIKDKRIDVAFIALHGRFGEDGTVQKILDLAAIPYTGSGPEASRLALDKIASKKIFARHGMPIPKYIVFEKGRYDIEGAHILGFPLVVKPQFEGSSIGLSIVKEKNSLKGAIGGAFEYGTRVILEEYIDGREVTVGILEDKPLPVIEILTRDRVYDYQAKYNDPETRYIVPAPIEKRLYDKAQDLGIAAHMALGCRSFSRVDMMIGKGEDIFVLEVNTIPGMSERSLLPKAAQAIGLNFNQLCVKLVKDALK